MIPFKGKFKADDVGACTMHSMEKSRVSLINLENSFSNWFIRNSLKHHQLNEWSLGCSYRKTGRHPLPIHLPTQTFHAYRHFGDDSLGLISC